VAARYDIVTAGENWVTVVASSGSFDRLGHASTLGGPTMFARISVMRASNRDIARVFGPSRKDKHWGRRKLKRDECGADGPAFWRRVLA